MTPPRLPTLLAVWVCLLLAGWLVVGVRTQPAHAPQERPCGVIVGLVLDGGPTTTAPRSTAGRPVAQIPYRSLDDPHATTTTEKECSDG